MKNNSFRSNDKNIRIILLCIALVLLLGNTLIELGVLDSKDNSLSAASKWIYTIVSSVFKSVGIAIIIGYITSAVSEFQVNHRKISKSEFKRFINDTFSVNGVPDTFKTEKADILYDAKLNYRYDAKYNVIGYIENNKVVTKTTTSFTEEKTSGKHDSIISFSNVDSIKVEYISINDPDDTNNTVKYIHENVDISDTTAFSNDLKYQYSVNISKKLKKLNKLHVEKCVIEYGEDHWQNYALLFMRPCKGVNFTMNLKDDLVIKEVIIFGEDKRYLKKQTENSLLITSDSWISNYNGFSIIIARKQDQNTIDSD